MSIYDDITAMLQKIKTLPPLPARLECGQRVYYALRRDYYAEPAPFDLPASITGVSVIVKDDMDENAWRFLDNEGAVMTEGTLS